MNTILLVKPLPLSRCRVITSASKKEDASDKRKAFRDKMFDSRKQTLKDVANNIKQIVKQEVSETRTIFDDHVKFFRQNPKQTSTKKSKKPEAQDVEVIDAEFFE
jgi:nitric oxide reductase large subunit